MYQCEIHGTTIMSNEEKCPVCETERREREGFEFTDDRGNDYRCQPWGSDDVWWLFYRHADGRWVSFRELRETEIEGYRKRSEEER